MTVVSAIEAPQSISNAIQKASRATGVDFSYLLETAARESSFNKGAKAKTSSAAGLFQFIESTWLKTVKDVGDEFGLDKYTPHIFKTRSGRYYVPNQKLRNEILQLRHNPEISAMMAGAFTQKNSDFIATQVGREPTAGELYIAHFLGAQGASKLISLAEDNPDARADRHFPAAARANRPIFYSRGRPRTIAQVYKNLVRHHQKLEAAAPKVAEKALEPALAPALAVSPLAQHFKLASPKTNQPQVHAVAATDQPLWGSPARQVIPSEQDLKALTHKVAISQASAPPPAASSEIGEGVEAKIIENGDADTAFGLAGQKGSPFGPSVRVAALVSSQRNPPERAWTPVPVAMGSIGSWTTIVNPPSSVKNDVPPSARGTPSRPTEPIENETRKTRRRNRAPGILEQSAQRASSLRTRAKEALPRFGSNGFWERMAANAG